MAKSSQVVYGSAVRKKYEDQANQILAQYGRDPWSKQQNQLRDQQNDFNNYLSSGNYTTDNNQKYRDMATRAVADLDEQMKRYGKSSNEYKTLDSYKNYYQNALPNFDRMDVTANARDYLSYDYENNKFTNWHTQEDYDAQKAYLDQQRQALQTEMDAIEDQTSADYLALKSWQEQYDTLAEALEERNTWDRQFTDINDYTAYEQAGDYKNSIQAKQTLTEAQNRLKEKEAELKTLEMKFAGVDPGMGLTDQQMAEYNQMLQLQNEQKQLQADVLNLTSQVAGIEKWQKSTATQNLYLEYGEDADYEQILDDLIAARDKAQEGTEDWAKIDLQIRALAGENENGLNENGQYDDNTLYGRAVMRDFDVEAGQKRLEEIDQELKDLGVSASRFWGGVANADNNFGVDAAGMVYTDENAVGESDPRVMALRAEKTELTRKLNSAAKFQEKEAAEKAFGGLSEEEHNALREAGLQHISQKGDIWYRDSGYDPTQSSGMLENFQYLDDELGGDIRDMLIEAVGAEALGRDIGYTADDILRLYQGDINHIAGKKEADKISAMDSDFARWNRQVLGVGTQAGLNQFVTGMRQTFSDDYIEPNKTAYKAQYTREDLKRYGDENIVNGSNISQVLFDTTQTTANMLPMIAASYLMTKAGLAPVAGKLVGAGLMGLSSGGNTYQQALSEGWDKQDAKAYATILGAAEGTMQYLIGGIGALGGVGEEGLLKAATGINNAAVRFATETGIHILSETTEELAQNRLQRYLDYKLGATDDADWMSWNDDDWYTVIVTALSTGALESGNAGRTTFGAQRLGEQLSGQRVIPSKTENGSKAVISEIGKAMQSDEALSYTLLAMATSEDMQGTDAYELAERMESGKAPKNAMNLGNLYRDIVSEYVNRNRDGGYEDATAGIIGGAIKYHAIQSAETELEAANSRAAEVRKANPGAEVLGANESRLAENGAPATQAVEFAAIMNKVMSGSNLTESEMTKLLGESRGAQAARLVLGTDTNTIQPLRMALTRGNIEEARNIIGSQIQTYKDQKAQRKAAEKMSVVQAAIEAATGSEVKRAAVNAVPQERVAASEVKAIQQADTEAQNAKQRLEDIKKMSFKEMAKADVIGKAVGQGADLQILANTQESLKQQMQDLQKRADELTAVKFPSKEQRTELADIREQQASVKQQMVSLAENAERQFEQQTASQPQATAEEAAKSNDSVDTIVVGGARMTRDAFIQDFSARLIQSNPNLTQEQAIAQANARFNELSAQTAQKGNADNGQTTNQAEQRNGMGDESDSGTDRERGDRSEQSADRFGADNLEELRTEPRGDKDGHFVAWITKDASKVDNDHVDVLEDEYDDIRELTDSLKRSGFKKITYVLDGDIVNALKQSVPAVYIDGELFLRLDYPLKNYDYVGTAEHERLHMKLDLMRAKFGEENTRAFVSSTLQNLLGREAFIKAFDAYAKTYGPLYRNAAPKAVAHMICEEMLCDMVGGIDNFGESLGNYLEDAEGVLEASKFNVVIQNLVDNPAGNPGEVIMEDIEVNSLPYGIPSDTLLSGNNPDNPSTAPADPAQTSRFAFFGLADALGFKVDSANPKEKIYYLNDEDARLGRNGFTQVTVDMIKQSPIGDLIQYSVDKGDITAEEAERQYNLFASIASITDQTHDFYQAMQFMGSTIFTALKANSDAQYGTTYDFPSICTKTQAIINEMSAQMVAKGRSLTEAEIKKAYNDVFNDGNPVPCPECYVFSRWVGIGGLLDNIRSYQERFGSMTPEQVIREYDNINKEVIAFAEENGLSKGRAKGALAKKLDAQYKDLEENIQKKENQGEFVPQKDYDDLAAITSKIPTIRALSWIDEVYFGGKEHKASNVNPNFSVPIEVLYDLNEGETFARDYKEAWAFRTTQGAGYGKAITPYAEAILGEGMLVTANTTKAIKAKANGTLNNPYRNEHGKITESSSRGKNLKSARQKELNQLFIGGQRLQSTSDARFDNAVDYLLSALELQTMQGGAQVYTKVPGAVAFFNACKYCTNMSMMPKGSGLDANGNPVDTGVGGMDLATMMMLRKRFEYAGSITIGVNDAHIRALMAQEFRDFIIPYHASGGKMSLIEYFRQVQDPDLKGTTIKSSDYTKTQSDKILNADLLREAFGKTEKEIEDIHKFRDTRLWILTAGKSGRFYSEILDTSENGLTDAQINARGILQELYASMQNGGKWNDGSQRVKLTKGKVEHQIFPNEFWDVNSTYDTSSVNTQRYLDYCDALGFLHRFSGKTVKYDRKTQKSSIIPVTGYDRNGNRVELTDLAYKESGEIEPFFWKTLTDRRMYGNQGQYLEQPRVDLTNLKADTVATFAAPMGERRYNHRVSMTNAAERSANVSRNSIQEDPARQNYENLKGALDNVLSTDNEGRSENDRARELVERVEGLYSADTIDNAADQRAIVDAIRAVRGTSQETISDSWGNQITTENINPKYYTKEMSTISEANAEHGLKTVFFVDYPMIDGEEFTVGGFADDDRGIAYVKANPGGDLAGRVITDPNSFDRAPIARFSPVNSVRINDRHERLHLLVASENQAVVNYLNFIKENRDLDKINFWYQTHLSQGYDSFDDYAEEIAADLYAGALSLENAEIQKTINDLIEKIDADTKHGSRYSIQGRPATAQQAQARYSIQDEQSNNWAPEFYSKMANTINEWTNGKGQPLGAKMAANQVVGWLKGKGVKSEEIKWSGIIPYLEGKKTVTKEELQQVMAENEIRIETKVLESGEDVFEVQYDWDTHTLNSAEEVLELAVHILNEDEDMKRPDGEPHTAEDVDLVPQYDGGLAALDAVTGELLVDAKRKPGWGDTHWSSYVLPGGQNYREILFKIPELDYSNRASQIHWEKEAPGVIAHTRVQDMNAVGGGRVLFVEEIQSDLHNEGSEMGFQEDSDFDLSNYDPDEVETFRALSKKIDDLTATAAETVKYSELVSKLIPYAAEYYDANEERKNTLYWAKQEIEDILYDLDGKVDREYIRWIRPISVLKWLNGEQDGPLQPSSWFNSYPGEDRSEALAEVQKEAGEQLAPYITPEAKQLAKEYSTAWEEYDRLTKERQKVYDKLLGKKSAPPNVPFAGTANAYHEYVMKHLLRLAAEGDYDKVAWTPASVQIERWENAAQRGYKVFDQIYDKSLPSFMNKYGKQWGAKVSPLLLESARSEGEVWSVPVTEEMKKSVLETGQPLFSARGDVGYHAGDLGKAEYLSQQGYSRGTGHFGTGTYFVGEEEKVTKDSYYGKRPQHAVNFSDYNLYKVRNNDAGYRLHDALRVIDGGINREWIRPAVEGQFYIIDPTGASELARSKYGEDWASGDNLLNARLEYAKENGIDLLSLEEYKAKEEIEPDDEFAKYYYEDYVKETLKEEIGNINAEYAEFRNAVFDLNLLTGLNDAKTLSALLNVAAYQDATPRLSKSDSYATVFMKNMGYDGVDVRGTNLDNTMYGSVIYDVKPDTVLYSARDTNAPENSNPYPDKTLQHDILEHVRKGDLAQWIQEQATEYEESLENSKQRPPVIPTRGFVPPVTKRESEAIDKRNRGLIRAKGAMKQSEKAANDFRMAKEDEQGRGFHRFFQNAITAEQTQPAWDQAKKFAFTDVHGTFVKDSNKADLKWATDLISEDGKESAMKQFNRAAMAMDNSQYNITKSLALGQQLLIETSRDGDMQGFLDVLSSLAMLSGQAGKSLQAFRMLKQSGPIGELYYVQKVVKQLNERNAEKIEAGKMKKIAIPEDFANAVLTATTEEEQDKAVDNLIAEIAKQVPVTLMDKWNAWRYLAMLGNARTHIRNIVGNAIFVPLRFTKDLMAAGGELIFIRDEKNRRKALFVPKELRDFAAQDAKAMEKELRGNGKYNPMREIMDARKIFKSELLNKASKANGELLEKEDWWFLSPAYQKALSQALVHTGYSLDEMLSGENLDAVKALNNARKIAIEEAQKATYRDFSATAAMLNRIKRLEGKSKFAGVLLEGVLPFTKTPINILKRGVEYSPVGLVTSLFEAASNYKNGTYDAAEFIDHISAGLSGTALVIIGYLMTSLGWLRGKKDDKEEEFEKLQGYQDYSLQIGDVSATIDWAAPTALPLFTGGALYDFINNDQEFEWKDAWNAMMMIAEPMMSLSMLDGLNNVLSSASYADDSQKLLTIGASAFTSYVGQAFPTIAGQLARSMDGTRRATYVDKNSKWPGAIQRFVQSSVQSKTPGWEEQKIPYIDQWGREDTVNSKALGALENFFSPSYINLVHTTDVDETLKNLYEATGESGVLPARIQNRKVSVNGEDRYLTAEQFVDISRYAGSTKYNMLAQLFSDPRYQALTDEQKVKAVGKVYDYANYTGKYYIWNDYNLHNQGAWMEEMYNAPTDAQRFSLFWEHLVKSLKLDQ